MEQTTASEEDAQSVEIGLIDPNPVQPRSHFDEIKLTELADSIRANGLVQPVVLRRYSGRYQIVAGERRLRAAQIAGLSKIPSVIREVPDEKLLELALIENIQREELNPIEEAGAYQRLIESVGLTQEDLAKRVGRDRSYITNYLRLLRLPEDLQQLLQQGKISAGHARTLLGLVDVEAQRRLAKRIADEQLSVREVEKIVRGTLKHDQAVKRIQTTVDPNVAAAESKLRRRFGTKVRIIQGEEGRGKIELEFYGDNDLSRLYDLLMASSEAGTAGAL